MPIPTLETDRLTLRPFAPIDLDRLADILADPDVMRYMPGGQPMSRERAERNLDFILKHWEQHGYGWWAVVLNPSTGSGHRPSTGSGHRPSTGSGRCADGVLIGWCGLAYVDELSETEVAYLLDKPYWGQGFATEAAGASLRYAFEELALDRVIALADVENIGSQRVMQKNGMVHEKDLHLWGLDLAYYAITRQAFEQGEQDH